MNDLTVSVLIDNAIKTHERDPNVSEINEKKLHSWVNDNTTNNCSKCKKEFTITRRKHHCRNCGKIFCYKCANYFIKIPESIDIPLKNKYINYYFNSGEERVCSNCYNNILEINNLNELIKFFNLLELSIIDYQNIILVCKTWSGVGFNYLNKFRNLHYKFPDYNFSLEQRNMLFYNRFYFNGHSKWLTQLIISFDWVKNNDKKTILDIILNTDKSYSCSKLMCSVNCKKNLDIEDIVIILSKKIIYKPLISVLIIHLKNLIIKGDRFNEFGCYLYSFINFLHFYKNYTEISNIFQKFLLNICSKNISFSNQLFWLLTQFIENPSSGFYFTNFRGKLVQQLDKQTYKLFQNGYDFTLNLIKTVEFDNVNAVINLKKFLSECDESIKNFTLPIDVSREFNYIDYDKIRDVDSKTKPIILPCIYEGTKVYNIMLKKEDIRKEAIIMNIIKLINYFLIDEENLDLHITTYNILPISSEYGYIEFVPDSSTLYHIKEDLKFSIQNWIIENNDNIDIDSMRDNICRSCAAFCIITYLLGIGDRHLDNIMITNKGQLFHIDFGFILGRDPKIMSPEIRLTPEIIDAMGGVHSKYYKNFKIYCNKAFKCIRRHSRIFYVLLCDLTTIYPSPPKINKEYINNFILTRFIMGGDDINALEQIQKKIEFHSAQNSYAETIIDYFHKKNKISSSKSSEQTNLLDKAYDYGNKTKNSLMKNIYNWFK